MSLKSGQEEAPCGFQHLRNHIVRFRIDRDHKVLTAQPEVVLQLHTRSTPFQEKQRYSLTYCHN